MTISNKQRPPWSLSSLRVVIPSNWYRREDAKQPRHQEFFYWLGGTQTRVPMVTTYHPKNAPVCKILSRNYNILTNDDSTRVIFPQPPLKANRRAKNLRDLLVHSDFAPAQPAQQPGTFPCKRTICRSCAHINHATSIPSPGGQIKITGHFTNNNNNNTLFTLVQLKYI